MSNSVIDDLTIDSLATAKRNGEIGGPTEQPMGYSWVDISAGANKQPFQKYPEEAFLGRSLRIEYTNENLVSNLCRTECI